MNSIRKAMLAQLPIPQINHGRKTGNIALGAACLKQAAGDLTGVQVEILDPGLASYMGDAALIDCILSRKPDMVGFTVYSWNVIRSLYVAEELKRRRQVQIVFGGPEVTPDNLLVRHPAVDVRVYGEGEAVFRDLLTNPEAWSCSEGSREADSFFQTAPSPYLSGLLDAGLEGVMLIETQRGCPYRCGYCYYGKHRRRVSAAPQGIVLDGIRWAKDRGVPEVFLLDPSLNARPCLGGMLDEIGNINRDRKIALLSEIRAEAVDQERARQFSRAGFTEFEIGLQTITPAALRIMNRPMDRDRFLQGVKLLQEAGIQPKIDLIAGLPGDDPEGFRRSVDFVAENGMAETVQVFCLSVLPGTAFRRRSPELGLVYDPRPPYTVIETPTFPREAIADALAYGERAFDLSLAPSPDLDLAFRPGDPPEKGVTCLRRQGIHIFSEAAGIFKVIVDGKCPPHIAAETARRLAHPYQVFFMPGSESPTSMCDLLAVFTRCNPHTPLEIVFFGAATPPDFRAFEASLALHRPLYLDLDLPIFGTRSVVFTWVSRDTARRISGPMRRQVFHWTAAKTPDQKAMAALEALDGVLMDNALPTEAWVRWQDDFGPRADDLVHVSFADHRLQQRWRDLAAPGEYRAGGVCPSA